jgi:hypothetical protein
MIFRTANIAGDNKKRSGYAQFIQHWKRNGNWLGDPSSKVNEMAAFLSSFHLVITVF